MKITFSDEGDLTHCEIIHEGKSGKGSVNKAAITGAVKLAIRKHGTRKVAHALGCQDEKSNYREGAKGGGAREHIPGIIFGIADAINTEAKCQALHKAATSMGWNPFGVLKKAAWDYNPVVFAAKKSAQFARGGLKAVNPFKRRRKKSSVATPAGKGGPEAKEDSTPEEDVDEANEQDATDADASSGYELMQKWDIMGIGCDSESGWFDGNAAAGDDFVQGDLDGSDSDEPMAGSAGSTDNMFDIGDSNEPTAGILHHNAQTYGLEAFAGRRGMRGGHRGFRGGAVPAYYADDEDYYPRRMRGRPPRAGESFFRTERDVAGDMEIGFAPLVAYQAYKHRQQLAKIAKSGNPRAANAAKSLHKAKSGDKNEQAKIKAINARAKKGDPRAKDAIKRLKMVDAMASRSARGPLGRLVHDGII